ncbi:MAG TPA: hypothetical protein VMV59_08905 [Candidatus Dormibacteraeota bacterium]|nr:hypothetical protein [Candidatus Dormibacteraeota bacterium]
MCKLRLLCVSGAAILLCAVCAAGKGEPPKKKVDKQLTCKTYFSVVSEDTLKNMQQGLAKKDVEWFEKKIEKKYPEVCYAPPSPDVHLVFFITVTPDVYHGTRVVTDTQTQDSPVTGTVTDQSGNTSTVDGTVTTTTSSSTAVPYSVKYGIFTLAIEDVQPDKNWKVVHRFQQDGLYSTYLGIPLGGKGHHPVHTIIEEAAKWIHEGGLTNPLQTVVP